MLSNASVTTMLPVKDMTRARAFYEGCLGLKAGNFRPDGKFEYAVGGSTLALFPKPEGTKAEHTAISFRVPDIAPAVLHLAPAVLAGIERAPRDPDYPADLRFGLKKRHQTEPESPGGAGDRNREQFAVGRHRRVIPDPGGWDPPAHRRDPSDRRWSLTSTRDLFLSVG